MTTNNTDFLPNSNLIMNFFMNSKNVFVHPITERKDIKLATFNKPGVYLLYNKVSGKYYVESSRNLYKRLPNTKPFIKVIWCYKIFIKVKGGN